MPEIHTTPVKIDHATFGIYAEPGDKPPKDAELFQRGPAGKEGIHVAFWQKSPQEIQAAVELGTLTPQQAEKILKHPDYRA